MEYGLECFDANGNKIFDTDLATSRYLGTANTGTANGSITDANINNGNVWIIVTSHPIDASDAWTQGWRPPRFTTNDNTISWQFDYAPNMGYIYAVDFIYGVYL